MSCPCGVRSLKQGVTGKPSPAVPGPPLPVPQEPGQKQVPTGKVQDEDWSRDQLPRVAVAEPHKWGGAENNRDRLSQL